MPFNGSGVYERSYDWTTDRDANVKINADRTDTETDGIVAAINAILGGTQGFLGVIKGLDGTAALPAYSFTDDPNTGIFREGADNLAFSVAGTKEAEIEAGYLVATNGLKVNGTVIDPDTIGSLDVNTLTHAAGAITVDCSAQARVFDFVADTYTPASATVVASTTTNTTGSAVTIPGTPQENDVVAVFGLGPYGSAVVIATSGYSVQYSNGTRKTSVYTKVMGGTPDTTVELSTIPSGGVLIVLFRGVDTSTNLDATTTTNENWSASTTVPDPAAITTVTDNSLVFAFIVDNGGMAVGSAAPSGYTKVHGSTIGSNTSASFYKLVGTAGSEDPGTFATATDYWAAFTTAWRAGSASGVKDYTVSVTNVPASGYTEVFLNLELKTTLGSWTWPTGNWIGGSAPAMNTAAVHVVKIVYFDGTLQHLEYIGERAA